MLGYYLAIYGIGMLTGFMAGQLSEARKAKRVLTEHTSHLATCFQAFERSSNDNFARRLWGFHPKKLVHVGDASDDGKGASTMDETYPLIRPSVYTHNDKCTQMK